MIKATKEFLEQNEALFESRKAEILNTKDNIKITGTAYYVAQDGDDNNDGKTKDTAWKTLKKVNDAELQYGDGVFFKRGDLFRGNFVAKPGVTYAAYGEGDKPKLYSGDKNMAEESLWELYDKEHNIWKYKEKIRDVGTLVFDDGVAVARKLIPNFIKGKFYLRDDITKEFVMQQEMTQNLDVFCDCRKCVEGEEVPRAGECLGDLYLRSDNGNPGKLYTSIEPLLRFNLISVLSNPNVTIDNLCIKYVGAHGIGGGGFVRGLTVTNCEFGWIGGAIQFFAPYNQGRVTRFGNAIEIYGGCLDYKANNNYIYQIYDAGITHQFRVTSKTMMENIEYKGNLIEKCVYGIEYFLDQLEGESESRIKNCVMEDNFIRLSGYGWGQQRLDVSTPAAIKSWNHTNMSQDFIIKNNIFDRGEYNFLHLCAITDEHCATLDNNTYIQRLGKPLGKYGGYSEKDPPIQKFDMQAEEKINNIFGDKNAKVYYID
ncbi:MAG: hypothetical protein IJD45_01480 [Clostridia bacterium]|nr:hypothetical protein [Clostridia bacterium]